jgi:heavy metal translocating P-type ATPase
MVEFFLPLLVLLLTIAGFITGLRSLFFLAAIAIGLFVLIRNSVKQIFARHYSLDYIAILAMVVSLATNELIAGAVISIMILVSEALEAYSSREAEDALKKFVEKIPKTCQVKIGDGEFQTRGIREVAQGDIIFIRPEEIIPLDGYLSSEHALMNEANLTGELEPQAYAKGQLVKSGLINLEASIELRVTGDFSHSTYQKIANLVGEAKQHPARIVRLAEKYNYGFTAITLVIAGAAYLFSHNWTNLLAVLVMATPCPLLIAAPVSFLGGLNKASRKNIIVKKPAALETLAQITTIFFDKTGTLTLGEPRLREIKDIATGFTEETLLVYAAAVELHSLHPLAKAVVQARAARALPTRMANHIATDVIEKIGEGITGTVAGKIFRIKKSIGNGADGIVVDVFADDALAGRLVFDDEIKSGTVELLNELKKQYAVAILTGDEERNAERLFGHLDVTIHAHCLPEDKFAIVKAAQAKGGKVMMVGDGLNDAPALALADVGVVFSGTENSASIEAAAVAILSRNIDRVQTILTIAKDSTRIAKESILWGIGLSIVGMLFAAFGYIPPVTGAILQEGIDVTVILNALRAAR